MDQTAMDACRETLNNGLKTADSKRFMDPFEQTMQEEKAAGEKRKDSMKACMASATSSQEKSQCNTDADAAVQKVMGVVMDAGASMDMKENSAMDAMETAMQDCMTNAGNDANAMMACTTGSSVKDALAESLGIDAGDVSDTQMQEYMDDSATVTKSNYNNIHNIIT